MGVSFYMIIAVATITIARLFIFGLRSDKFVSLSVNVDNLYHRVVLKQLALFGDINIHAAGIEIVVVYPDALQSEVPFQNLVHVST